MDTTWLEELGDGTWGKGVSDDSKWVEKATTTTQITEALWTASQSKGLKPETTQAREEPAGLQGVGRQG